MTTINPPSTKRSLFASLPFWLVGMTVMAAAWVFACFVPKPKPLTHAGEKQRRKALVRAAKTKR